jgi:outer membrane receptor protein involved in Fe transport
MSRGFILAVVLSVAIASTAAGDPAPMAGRSVSAVIDEFRAAGYPFAYSDALVTGGMVVEAEPDPGDPADIVRQILEPYRLTVRYEAGIYLVIPAAPGETPPEPPVAGTVTVRPDIENITVSASRYEIGRDISSSKFRLDRRTIQNMPDVGEDPLRVTQRLPGAAASGASAKTHFRGGEESEVGIMLNGQNLFDPFHVRDYQNIFSAIDSRAIEGVEVFTGGFPVRFGDRMSGFVLMNSMEAEKPRHTELGISVYNTSVLTTGSQSDRRWLFSARRGNLDLVIDPEFGRPKYFDVFGEYAVELSSRTTLSVNALYADDSVTVVLETDPDEREQMDSDTRNAQLWLQLTNDWSEELATSTVFSLVEFENLREGFLNDEEKIVANVRDARDVRQLGVRQDWTWRAADRHVVQWGVEVLFSKASYDYAATAQYFGLPALYPDQPDRVDLATRAAPEGGSYGAYVADRWKLADGTMLEWGLRWDDQTYTGLTSDSQLSPRLSVLHRVGERTDLRVSWGRYHQSQGIHQLQVEDDITGFWPAQSTDQLIAGLQHRFDNNMSLRVELFRKDVRKVRPRFENLYDPLGLIPELQPDRVRLDPSRARASGAEISLGRNERPWHWWASYTWSRTTDRIEARDEYRSWDQRHSVQGGFGWSSESWDVSFAGNIHSGWPRTDLFLVTDGADSDGEPEYVVVPGQRNALRHDYFASLDFRVSRRFAVKRGTLSVFLEVSNVLDRENVCCLDWDIADGPDGTEELELSHDFWLPRLPAVGILWEF